MGEDGAELWQVESLTSALRIPRSTGIRRGRPREPDVVFKHPLAGKSIGVEVTEIHPCGVEQRRREEEAGRIVRGQSGSEWTFLTPRDRVSKKKSTLTLVVMQPCSTP